MNTMTLTLIIGMFLVTYIPRMLPMVLTKDLIFPPLLEKWLSYVPYAALGALIFPGVFTVLPERPWLGFIASAFAFIVAWYVKQMIIVLLVAVSILFLFQ